MKKSTYLLAMLATAASLFLTNFPLFASETDDRIESSAKDSYVFMTYLKDDNITINSQDGVATLTGTVSDASHKALAQETVANLPGVTGVNNKLEEKSEGPAPYTDAWLVSKVQATLLFHRTLHATQTEVSAKDGIVTLRGEATNTAEKDLATEYAKDVDGVKDVENEMTVSTVESKSGGKTMGQTMNTMGQKMGLKVDVMTEAIDDASITALVKMTLLYHRSTSAINTTVKTNDGVVTLGGKATNTAEKELATKFVSDIYGVKSVVNNMTVE